MTIELGWWMVPFVAWAGYWVFAAIDSRREYRLSSIAIGLVVAVGGGWLFMAAARWL